MCECYLWRVLTRKDLVLSSPLWLISLFWKPFWARFTIFMLKIYHKSWNLIEETILPCGKYIRHWKEIFLTWKMRSERNWIWEMNVKFMCMAKNILASIDGMSSTNKICEILELMYYVKSIYNRLLLKDYICPLHNTSKTKGIFQSTEDHS